MRSASRSVRYGTPLIGGLLMLLLAPPGAALERRSARAPEASVTWARAATCEILYYNTCQGWIWTWGGWDPTDRLGVAFGAGPGSAAQQLSELLMFVSNGAPSGYGFTGTLEVHLADEQDCPAGGPLHSQPFLPASGWNTVDWTAAPIDVSGGDFVVSYKLANTAQPDPVVFASDHPLAGPTGSVACGTCFPSTRTVRSYYYGTASAVLCPGAVFSDGACDVEWLWDCKVQCTTPVEATSWGHLKALYR
jgi:hypothetical protein